MQIEVPIKGIHCASCIETIDYAASKTNGVIKAATNFATKSVFIDAGDKFRLKELNSSLKKHGYRIATNIAVLLIPEIDTSEQAKQLAKRLEGSKGVVDAAFNLQIRALVIEYVPKLTAKDDLIRHIKGFGYNATAATETSHVEDPVLTRLTIAILCSAAAMAGIFIHSRATYYAGIAAMLITYIYCALPIHKNALRTIASMRPDMNTLVSIATTAGVALSAYYLTGAAPAAGHDMDTHTPTLLITVILAGRYIEERLKKSAMSAGSAIMTQVPREIKVKSGGRISTSATSGLKAGDVIILEEKVLIPVDCKIIEGQVLVDESTITGEPGGRMRSLNDRLLAGATVESGYALAQAETGFGDSFMSQITALSHIARGSRHAIQSKVDRIAGVFVPVVLAIASLTFAYWMVSAGADKAIISSINVLLIACPCALGLATPIAVNTAVGNLLKEGILIKNIDAVERARRCDTFVFDKTGTISSGRFSITEIKTLNGFTEDEVLTAAAAIESAVSHPFADLIKTAASSRALSWSGINVKNIKPEPGMGVTGFTDGRRVHIGSAKYMKSIIGDQGLPKGRIFVAIDGRLAAAISVSETLNEGAASIISRLKNSGKNVVVLSGDKKEALAELEKQYGITAKGELLSHEKIEQVWDLRQQGKVVAYIGDGINDIAAMKGADVSISFKGATNQAIENCDIVIVKGGLENIWRILDTSGRLNSKVAANIVWASAYNILMIPVAAGALGIPLSPIAAAAAMSASSIVVVLNSVKL